MAILECKNLAKSYGLLKAVNNLNLVVKEVEILAVSGPNGSGKSTTLNLISKVVRPDGGTMVFDGRRIDRLPPHKVCRLGLVRTFQVPVFFSTMTVEEQVRLAADFGTDSHDPRERTTEALSFVGMTDKANKLTGTLDLYCKKKLMIATALATKPKLLMLDEPFAGLNDQQTLEGLAMVTKLREAGVAFIIIERNIRSAFSWADRVVVMDGGEKIADGSPSDIAKNAQAMAVFLGEEYI